MRWTWGALSVFERRERVQRRAHAAKGGELKTELTAFCAERRSLKELASARDGLFRAILLDAVTMLELLEETEIRGVLQRLQRQLLEVLKEGKPLILQNRIPVAALGEAIDRYAELIREQIGRD